jgi:DNA replication and repair protein RecF
VLVNQPSRRVLSAIEITHFRCIEHTRLALHPELSVVLGQNGSGKTSVLEAIFFLGRGRSFRQSANATIIRHGSDGFRLVGELREGERIERVGVEYAAEGFRVRIAGEERRRLSDLASWVPAAVIDPEVHELVQGSPEHRRRFLDWGVFHVEPEFGEVWTRYQRTLRQRNAALRTGVAPAALLPWSASLAELGERITAARERYLEQAGPGLEELAAALVGCEVRLRYQRGWSRSRELLEALQESAARDSAMGSTQAGPHRADLLVEVAARGARGLVSRGQQKMLAAALVLGQVRAYADMAGARPLLLLDDPAAELDDDAQARLLAEALATPAQRVVTGLRPDPALAGVPHALFHVERGVVSEVL